MEQTTLRGIANKAAQDKAHRFRNLFGLLTARFLLECWEYINKRASAGVDRIDAIQYESNLIPNIKALAESVKRGSYRAKLVLRKYIPKGDGKERPLGIPAIADKLLQLAVAKILEAIYEQDFYDSSYGYRPKIGAHKAVKALSEAFMTGRYHTVVEADIKGYFNNIDHQKLIAMLEKRIDDKPFLKLINKWLKAGILDKDIVTRPEAGTPQGGSISPILANIYLHHVLDEWFYQIVQPMCRGQVYLNRYADDFVCAFENEHDAKRYYKALKQRLNKYNLEVAEDKTRLIAFSPLRKRGKTRFDYLGFEFSWGLTRKIGRRLRRPIIKRRTSRKKLRASRRTFKDWLKDNTRLPKKILFAKLNRKLRGYYQYYGIRGNSRSLGNFAYYVTLLLFKWINRHSQRKSYNWMGFRELVKHFGIAKPRIYHAF